jgi:nucleotide-binding universal stress UspA family protein
METNNQSEAIATASNLESKPVNFKKILVAVDYQPATQEVFIKAIELAEIYQSSLMVCHCIPGKIPEIPELITAAGLGGFYSPKMFELEEQLLEEATEELQAWLHSFSQQASDKGIPTDCDYLIGNPGEEICALAKSWQADLIVIGRRGLTGVSEMFFGSVSNYVFHHAPCSVLIVQHPEERRYKRPEQRNN